MTPSYLSCPCLPTAADQFRSRLCSAPHGHLTVPFYRTALGARSFAIAGPHSWTELPVDIRDPTLSLDRFKVKLKTHLFKIAYS